MTISVSVKDGKWHRTSLTTDAEVRDVYLSRRKVRAVCGVSFSPFNSAAPGETPRAHPRHLCSKCYGGES
jgi:hypothetical protein